ncbi:hypothetical protein LZ554_001395 [Drepanopeziza brunnea f. sp. 'monogermtubi']|nr:hypothetical protein LZ554_001395 [Drepanopeziza brunnea f. sp. 'monogermtubi']
MTFPMRETRAGTVFSVVLSMVSMSILAICLSRRVQNVRDWSRLPLVCWLILVIYGDSIIFVLGSAIVSHGYGVGSSPSICAKAVLLCLACYMTTKLFIYYFLVERVFIIRRSTHSRMKDRLYLFNSFGMLVPYLLIIALNFYFRFATYKDGTCLIGIKRLAMIPLIAFDILVNVYLTSLFLIPLRSLHSYKTDRSSQTRTVALRTFIGSCLTLTSSIVNLTVAMALKGEPGWICLMCCNVDILFSVLVLHWITSKDNASTFPTPNPNFLPRDSDSSSSKPSSPGRLVRLVPRPPIVDMEACHRGLRDLSRKSGITTMVTAKGDDVELERMSGMRPNVVTITVEMNIQHREAGVSDLVRPEKIYGSAAGAGDLGIQRMRAMASRDELFFRREKR